MKAVWIFSCITLGIIEGIFGAPIKLEHLYTGQQDKSLSGITMDGYPQTVSTTNECLLKCVNVANCGSVNAKQLTAPDANGLGETVSCVLNSGKDGDTGATLDSGASVAGWYYWERV